MREDKWMIIFISLIIFMYGALYESVSTTNACKERGKFISGGVVYICTPQKDK